MKAKVRETSKPGSVKTKRGSSASRTNKQQAYESLQDYQAILATAEEVAQIGSWKWDLKTQKLTWSDQMFRLFGVERDSFNGDLAHVITSRIHPDDVPAVNEANRKVLEDSDPQPMAYRILLPDGAERTVWARGKLTRDEEGKPIALTGYVQDITERIQAEKKVTQMKRLYATLSQVNQLIVRVRERDELFETICGVARKFGQFSLAWVGVLDLQTGDIVPTAASGADVKRWPFPIPNIHTGEYQNSLAPMAIRTGSVVTTVDIQNDARTHNFHHMIRRPDYHAAAAVPIRLRGQVIGGLMLVAPGRDLFNDPEEIYLLEEMGLDISFALDNMENEKARRQAEQKITYQARLLENINDAILATDAQFRITNWNHAAEMLYGYKESEVLGLRAADVLRSEFSDEQRATALKDLKEYGSSHVEVLQYHRDGHSFWVDGSTFAIKDASGQTEGYISINRNITEHKQTQQALIESEQRFRLLLERVSNIAVQGYKADGTVHFWNKASEQVYGYSSEEALGKNLVDLIIPPDMRETVRDAIKHMIETGEGQPSEELTLMHKDGHGVPVYSNHTVTDIPGRGRELYCIDVDLTERKRAEELVRRNEQVLRLFVEHSPASIAMFDKDMKYIVASRRYLIDYRLAEQDVTGRSHYEIFPEIPDHWKEIHRRCLAGAIEKADEDPFPRQDGTLDWVQWEIRPWYEESGSIGGIILFSEVVTERKNIQDELRHLNIGLEQRVVERTTELEHANRVKDEFLANMSHELRTPLSSILGLSESLLEERRGAINEHQKRSLEVIHASGQHLLELINDILDLSKIEAGKLEYSPQVVSVDEICKSSLVFIRAQATKKSICLTYDNQAVHKNIVADQRRLKQVLVNLLSNAVKFTPDAGNIMLRVSTNTEQDLIQFDVIDNGIGIAPQDLERLFHPFVQVDSSLNRQYEGSGLGLALVQKLVDLHGGSIHVESEPGKGSRFTVQLNCSQQAITDSAPPQVAVARVIPTPTDKTESSIRSMTRGLVLLAEDNTANIITIAEYLEDQGFQVIVARDGNEAIQKAEEINPDIILMDIQMPVLNGLAAIGRLRSDIRFARTPIIALTALAMAGDRERCLAAGASEYMSKPVRLKGLVNAIDQLLPKRTGN